MPKSSGVKKHGPPSVEEIRRRWLKTVTVDDFVIVETLPVPIRVKGWKR